jgi:eukaryotic-like serine/threonine-protein kinase
MVALWHVGDRIQNRWEVHHVQPGSVGLVYIVYDHETQLPYAVKTLQKAWRARHAAVAERFVEAAHTWINLETHAHLVQAHFVEMIDGQPLLFLEYVSGGDLRDWLGIPRLTHDLPQVVRLAMQCCDGMTHALGQGVQVHRDMKPSNCLITSDGALKLTDVSIASVFDGLEAEPDSTSARSVHRFKIGPGHLGTVAGTCTHMAPELFDDPRQVDGRADIYAFGVLLFQMATGKLPFNGQTWQELAHLHRTQPLPALSPQLAGLGPLLETCLAKDPAQRMANFHAVREQLDELYTRLTNTPAPLPVVGPELEAVRWTNTGIALDNLGRHQVALACYDRALAIDAHHELAWVHRGTALEALGQMEDALACCDHALQLNSRSEQALLAKGMMHGALGQLEEARQYCDRALKINPRNEQAWVNMGTALDALGRRPEALGCYNNALTLNPRNAQAWFNAGVVLGDMGRHEEALGCCERSLALNPHNEQAWVNRGLTLAELQRSEEALACFDRALALNPRLEQGWFNKGVALVHVFQRYAEALVCFEEAERLGNTQAAEGIALCRQELGQS